MSEPLNPLTLPLRGSRLIEASAGTGKTWTIAALYVRLILGHGTEGAAPVRPLMPGEILVMTFTKAATRELSDRIRHRLVEAAAWFRGEVAPGSTDPYLDALLADHPPGPARAEAAWRLAMAAEAMDDAAVYTIDAWCQRMLREHAFDSGCLFDEELEANETALFTQAVHDYWRQQVYPLDGPALAAALALWGDVRKLAVDVQALLYMDLNDDADRGSLRLCIDAAGRARIEALAALKQGWVERASEMERHLDELLARQDAPVVKTKLKANDYRNWLARLRTWSADPGQEDHGLTSTARERLTPGGLRATFKEGVSVVVPAVFEDFATLMRALEELPVTSSALRAHAAASVIARMQVLKAQAGLYGYADMLDRLHAALDEDLHGAKARRLRQRIVEQYPVALIDEFQDTSPVQLGIFDRLYRIATDDPALGLLLIGDPKQSIYGFRGADIYSYLGARRATAGRHHMLGTNHRSTRPLVAAVNRMFEAAEARPGQGAFMFRSTAHGEPPASETAGLPFTPVDARGRREHHVVDARPRPAMTICVDPELRGSGDSRRRYAARCAEHIAQLLNDPQAGFVDDAGTCTRVRPADIAVLVRTGTEAAAVRGELRRRGLASVYLSDKDSVFSVPEAKDLLRLLRAVAAPRNVRLARAAFATELLGQTLGELVHLAVDDERFDAQCDLLRELHATWQAQGVLAMVRHALHGYGLPARWLAHPSGEGERRLTDVLHLAELMQAASAQLDGEQALIRWLAGCIEDATGALGVDESQVLRLESDADLVQVVTVYKSKGLEYPLVFLPFAAHFRPVDGKNTKVVALPRDDGGRVLHLAPTAAQLQAADVERQREDLRLLYVAVTRARHGLWVGVAALKGRGTTCTSNRSAIGYLLSGIAERDAQGLLADIQALADSDAGIAVEVFEAEAPTVTRPERREDLPPLAEAPPYTAQFDRAWSIGSYSALVRDVARGAPLGAQDVPAQALRDDEPIETEVDANERRPASDLPWHRFPRGAFPGNFLHGMLEWLAGEDFALDTSATLQQSLVLRCERQGWGVRSADVLAWLRRVCTVRLPALGTSLAGLQGTSPELEFWFPSDGMSALAIDQLCHRYMLPGRPRPALPERTLRGMLMGYADLVFEQGGRYWVLDYKSNALGPRDADYSVQAMEAAMLEHRYDVQAALYLLALHRLLKVRLGPRYDPAQHLGGALYFFLRGVGNSTGGCLHLHAPQGLIDGLEAMLSTREPAA